MAVYEYQNQKYIARTDFYSNFGEIFHFRKLPNGRYYIPVNDIEPTIRQHVDKKVKRWLNSIKLLHKEKLKKWYSIVKKARHLHRLLKLSKALKKNSVFMAGLRKLKRNAKTVIDANWTCSDCKWRITKIIYYESCSCNLCEYWSLSSSTRDHKPTECVSYFCHVCNEEKSVPAHLKLSYQLRNKRLPYHKETL